MPPGYAIVRDHPCGAATRWLDAAQSVKTEVTPDGMTLTMRLDAGTADAGNASVSISVKGVCDQGPSTLSASVSWTGQAKVASPMVSVQEY